VFDRKLLLISGKGGVGSSAVTASLALAAARAGRTVLAMGMLDTLGLAAHLGAEDLDYQAREVAPRVYTLAVDRSRALDEYLRIQLRLPRPTPTRQLARALNVLVDTAPGVREIISIGKPVYEVWNGGYDLVLVDAPPLGQLFSYLRAPATIADLVPAGPIREQAGKMRVTLGDPATAGLVLVTTPEELPVAETREALDRLGREPVIDLVTVVANRTLPELAVPAGVVAGLPAGPHRRAAELHQALWASQRRWLTALPSGPRLPYLFGSDTPERVAQRLAAVWETP
jgi:anion-transporting  ArsA/GET3 family ATPase